MIRSLLGILELILTACDSELEIILKIATAHSVTTIGFHPDSKTSIEECIK